MRHFLIITLLAFAGCAAAAEPTTWRELPAFRLTDGRSEAVVVPSLGGRVLHYGLVGGKHWLWTGELGAEKKMPALYWGGDKTYLGPHTLWSFAQESMWPPPAPDFQPCEVVEARGLFSTLSAAWPGSGARIRRDYSFGKDGELIITHSVAPVPGSREIAALWVITQTVPTDAVFVPLAAQSPYKDGYFRFGFEKPAAGFPATLLAPQLLQLKPEPGVGRHITAPAPQGDGKPLPVFAPGPHTFVAHGYTAEGVEELSRPVTILIQDFTK